MYGYIYKTTNLVNGKMYIGQKKSSKFLGKRYLGSGVILDKAIKKYGKENFKVELLERCDSKEYLNDREIYWIEELNAVKSKKYYNVSSGGLGFQGVQSIAHHKQSIKATQKFKRLVSRIDAIQFKDFYREHSVDEIMIKFNVTRGEYKKLVKYFNLKHTKSELNTIVKRKVFEKYGVENPFQNKDVINKIKQTKLEKYGNENYSNRDKAKQTMIERYGSSGIMNIPTIRDKIEKSLIDKYGSLKNYHKIQNKLAITTMTKNGTYSLIANKLKLKFKDKDWRNRNEKSMKTLHTRYGVDNPSKLPNHREKCKTSGSLGKRAYNNGEITRMFFDKDVPLGWKLGRVKK